jgi:hypothetical protein
MKYDQWRKYNREKQAEYNRRKQEAGYQRATIWFPGTLLEQLRQEAKQQGSSLQNLIVEKVCQHENTI